MNKKITGKVLAVQLGKEESQLVLFDSSKGVLHTATAVTPADAIEDGGIVDTAAICEMLKEALKQPEFKKIRRVVFVLCSSQVIATTAAVPNTPGLKLEKLLRTNSDTYFPVDVTDYQLIWQIIGTKTEADGSVKNNVQIWAVPTALIQAYYTVANTCGLSVVAIDYFAHGMASVVGASFAGKKAPKAHKKFSLNMELSLFSKKAEQPQTPVEEPAEEERPIPDTLLHLLLNRDFIGMSFAQDGQVVMQRIISCGAEFADQLSEISMVLEYFRTLEVGQGSSIHAVVSGDHASNEQILADLYDTLGLDLEQLDVPYDPKFALCVCAAQTDLDFGQADLNAPDKTRKYHQSQVAQYGLVLASGLAVVAVVTFNLSAQLDWDKSLSELENQKQLLSLQLQGINGYADNYKKYQSVYNSYSNDWDTVFSGLKTNNDSLVLVLEELESIMPENSSVTSISISSDGLSLTFACEDKEAAAYLIMQLRELNYAELGSISSLQGGGGGAASSYGPTIPDEDDTTEDGTIEDDTTEGDATEDDTTEDDTTEDDTTEEGVTEEDLRNSITGDLNAYKVAYNLYFSDDANDELALLQKSKYKLTLSNTYATYDELKAHYGDELTEEIRQAAFAAMYRSNPYTMAAAEDLLMGDTQLAMHIYLHGKFNKDDLMNHTSPEDLEKDVETMLEIIFTSKYSGDFDRAEKLICNDSTMQKWYLYYLEAAMNGQDPAALPYLDLDKVIKDIGEDKEFNSAYDELNDALNPLISEQTKAIIDELTAEPDPTPTPDIDPDQLQLALTYFLPTYMREGTIDYPGAEDYLWMLDDYFSEGSSGNEQVDEILDEHFATGGKDALLDELYASYKADPDSLKNQNIRSMFDNYFEGSTNNTVLDQRIAAILSGTGNTGSTSTDTRIYFSVTLTYSEELGKIELIRNGLDYDDKIGKLEVAE